MISVLIKRDEKISKNHREHREPGENKPKTLGTNKSTRSMVRGTGFNKNQQDLMGLKRRNQ